MEAGIAEPECLSVKNSPPPVEKNWSLWSERSRKPWEEPAEAEVGFPCGSSSAGFLLCSFLSHQRPKWTGVQTVRESVWLLVCPVCVAPAGQALMMKWLWMKVEQNSGSSEQDHLCSDRMCVCVWENWGLGGSQILFIQLFIFRFHASFHNVASMTVYFLFLKSDWVILR